jgi:hypothetical protein
LLIGKPSGGHFMAGTVIKHATMQAQRTGTLGN